MTALPSQKPTAIANGIPNEVALRALIHLRDQRDVWRVAAQLNAMGVRVPGATDEPASYSYEEMIAAQDV